MGRMPNRLHTRWIPEAYQGSRARGRHFEGWYYKIVDRDERRIMAIIPGVSLGGSSEHAFIQVLDEHKSTYSYHQYGIGQFTYSRDEFKVEIGPNLFQADHMELDINRDQGLEGTLDFKDLHPWPVRIWSPGAMGALGLVPGIPCYHHVLSLDHNITGQLTMGTTAVDFDGGRGYTEKSWGRSFPSGWIWMQSNHFEDPGTSFVLAAARMRFHSRAIQGLTCGLLRGDRLHRFCTWSGGRIAGIAADAEEIRLSLESPGRRLEVSAIRSNPIEMRTPRPGGMTGRVMESLSSEINLALYLKGRETAAMEDVGRCAGVEVGGDAGEMVADGG